MTLYWLETIDLETRDISLYNRISLLYSDSSPGQYVASFATTGGRLTRFSMPEDVDSVVEMPCLLDTASYVEVIVFERP